MERLEGRGEGVGKQWRCYSNDNRETMSRNRSVLMLNVAAVDSVQSSEKSKGSGRRGAGRGALEVFPRQSWGTHEALRDAVIFSLSSLFSNRTRLNGLHLNWLIFASSELAAWRWIPKLDQEPIVSAWEYLRRAETRAMRVTWEQVRERAQIFQHHMCLGYPL